MDLDITQDQIYQFEKLCMNIGGKFSEASMGLFKCDLKSGVEVVLMNQDTNVVRIEVNDKTIGSFVEGRPKDLKFKMEGERMRIDFGLPINESVSCFKDGKCFLRATQMEGF